jgi:hypothetical protein
MAPAPKMTRVSIHRRHSESTSIADVTIVNAIVVVNVFQRVHHSADAKPMKLATTQAFVTEEAIEVRSRSLPESGGSGAQVNLDGI